MPQCRQLIPAAPAASCCIHIAQRRLKWPCSLSPARLLEFSRRVKNLGRRLGADESCLQNVGRGGLAALLAAVKYLQTDLSFRSRTSVHKNTGACSRRSRLFASDSRERLCPRECNAICYRRIRAPASVCEDVTARMVCASRGDDFGTALDGLLD